MNNTPPHRHPTLRRWATRVLLELDEIVWAMSRVLGFGADQPPRQPTSNRC